MPSTSRPLSAAGSAWACKDASQPPKTLGAGSRRTAGRPPSGARHCRRMQGAARRSRSQPRPGKVLPFLARLDGRGLLVARLDDGGQQRGLEAALCACGGSCLVSPARQCRGPESAAMPARAPATSTWPAAASCRPSPRKRCSVIPAHACLAKGLHWRRHVEAGHSDAQRPPPRRHLGGRQVCQLRQRAAARAKGGYDERPGLCRHAQPPGGGRLAGSGSGLQAVMSRHASLNPRKEDPATLAGGRLASSCTGLQPASSSLRCRSAAT